MSAAEPRTASALQPGRRSEFGSERPSTVGARRSASGGRLLLSEIGMLLRRRRNQFILLALIAIPIIIAVAVKLTTNSSSSSSGLIGGITNNGIFVSFTALVVVIPIFLPMAVAVVVGESVAGEAGSGTLRYLLTVPVSRTRLLAVKFAALAVWCLIIAGIVALAGLLIGFALFPAGHVTLLSGTQTSLVGGLGRLTVVVGYAALMMLAIAAIGLFISTLTEVPIAAMAATLAVAIIMQVLVAVPQLHSIRPLLLSNSLLDFADVLRDPLTFGGLRHGVLLALGYIVIFWPLAWARFTTKDISS
ncbi:ABC transporter permease [Jatrophihabitans lederbergiae]|uniref:ABC transporter permease subunit n=1 Tax=Jatrophihabitans lederbergiae TaxID=3075547 RepID=A0ABU2JDI4_9ACTN|nr:ABC transporter permease [Jatrophihabitans sp. DSM 44399]MDT0263037.1 ABC transporter permease subunit [Jatrophihabitans sp. DSM 44399]